LASKVTENHRRIRDCMNAGNIHVMRANVDEIEFDEAYARMKDLIIDQEHMLLRVLAFDTYVDLPHTYLLNIARELNFGRAVTKLALTIINDSILSERILSCDPLLVACAGLVCGRDIKKRMILSQAAASGVGGAGKHSGNRSGHYSSGTGDAGNRIQIPSNQWWRSYDIDNTKLQQTVDWIVQWGCSYHAS
jgi:hypothetical protein